MSKLLEKLNEQQKKAVLYTSGPLAIIAGAGSGKTRTITHKIAYLIKEKKIKSHRILAVAFTNKAASEMKKRVIDLVGPTANQAQISTYHSLCVKILKEDIYNIGYSRRFNIIDNIDQKLILKPAYTKMGLSPKTLPFNLVTSYISKNKFAKKTLSLIEDENTTDKDTILFELYKFYLSETKKTTSLDFDDLILCTEKLFKKFPEVVSKWSQKFDYVLADEFQDTSIIQYKILKGIATKKDITVVGDPDQTIFSWRQADPKLLINFKKDFPDAREFLLTENYRSTPEILEAANKLISFNLKRTPKELFTTKESAKVVEFFQGFSEDAEARWIVGKIQELKKEKNQLKNIAILFRSNYLSNSLEKALIKENIDYVLFGGVRFYQRLEIKDAISFLKVINNYEEIALRRIINTPARKIGKLTLEKLLDFKNKKQLPLWDAIVSYFKDLPVSKLAKTNLANFINLIRKYKAALKSNNISLVLEKFLIEIKYYSTISSEDKHRIESLKELIGSIKAWEKDKKNKTLNDFLEEISLFTDANEPNRLKDYVSLMTVHTSKGLEFDNVFVFGFSEGVFPSKRAIDEGGQKALEEERRLAYVAITRTKKQLAMTSSRGFHTDYTTQKKPSRFLKEMGVNYKNFMKRFIPPKNFKENYEKKNFVQGDEVIHEKFGKGEILIVEGDVVQVAFQNPHGVKTIIKNHKSIQRLGW